MCSGKIHSANEFHFHFESRIMMNQNELDFFKKFTGDESKMVLRSGSEGPVVPMVAYAWLRRGSGMGWENCVNSL